MTRFGATGQISRVDQDVAAAGGFLRWRRRHALPPGTGCFNCGTVLLGPWCHACGQAAEEFHRSAHHLVGEALENFFHADGRLWRTLPALLFRPGQLTRSYLDGHRAPQIPPMRLFLIAMLLVFLAGDLNAGLFGQIGQPDAASVASGQAELARMRMPALPGLGEALTDWLRTHLGRAIAHPRALVEGMGEWAHRFAFLALPVSALVLSAIFAFRRGFVLFDHLIFSMHSLAFVGLVVAAMLLAQAAGVGSLGVLLLVVPVHLFRHMRGVYATGVPGTLLRMGLLFVLSSLAFLLLLAALVLIGLASLKT